MAPEASLLPAEEADDAADEDGLVDELVLGCTTTAGRPPADPAACLEPSLMAGVVAGEDLLLELDEGVVLVVETLDGCSTTLGRPPVEAASPATEAPATRWSAAGRTEEEEGVDFGAGVEVLLDVVDELFSGAGESGVTGANEDIFLEMLEMIELASGPGFGCRLGSFGDVELTRARLSTPLGK